MLQPAVVLRKRPLHRRMGRRGSWRKSPLAFRRSSFWVKLTIKITSGQSWFCVFIVLPSKRRTVSFRIQELRALQASIDDPQLSKITASEGKEYLNNWRSRTTLSLGPSVVAFKQVNNLTNQHCFNLLNSAFSLEEDVSASDRLKGRSLEKTANEQISFIARPILLAFVEDVMRPTFGVWDEHDLAFAKIVVSTMVALAHFHRLSVGLFPSV